MRSKKRDHLSYKFEEDAPTPKRRRKKRKSKLWTVKPLVVTWAMPHAATRALETHLVKNSRIGCWSCRSNVT
jgi:hypothetical protein